MPEYDTGPFERVTRPVSQVVLDWDPQFIGGTVNLRLAGGTTASPRGLNGQPQIISGAGRYWLMSMSMFTIRPKHVRRFRGMIARARGRAALLRVPILDRYAPVDSGVVQPASPHSDGSFFSDTSGYAAPGPLRGVVGVVEEGANRLTLSGIWDAELEVGVYFNLGPDLHMVTARTEGAEDEIQFEPPARRRHAHPLINLEPYLVCRMVDEESGALPLDYGLWGRPTFEFEEDVNSVNDNSLTRTRVILFRPAKVAFGFFRTRPMTGRLGVVILADGSISTGAGNVAGSGGVAITADGAINSAAPFSGSGVVI